MARSTTVSFVKLASAYLLLTLSIAAAQFPYGNGGYGQQDVDQRSQGAGPGYPPGQPGEGYQYGGGFSPSPSANVFGGYGGGMPSQYGGGGGSVDFDPLSGLRKSIGQLSKFGLGGFGRVSKRGAHARLAKLIKKDPKFAKKLLKRWYLKRSCRIQCQSNNYLRCLKCSIYHMKKRAMARGKRLKKIVKHSHFHVDPGLPESVSSKESPAEGPSEDEPPAKNVVKKGGKQGGEDGEEEGDKGGDKEGKEEGKEGEKDGDEEKEEKGGKEDKEEGGDEGEEKGGKEKSEDKDEGDEEDGKKSFSYSEYLSADDFENDEVAGDEVDAEDLDADELEPATVQAEGFHSSRRPGLAAYELSDEDFETEEANADEFYGNALDNDGFSEDDISTDELNDEDLEAEDLAEDDNSADELADESLDDDEALAEAVDGDELQDDALEASESAARSRSSAAQFDADDFDFDEVDAEDFDSDTLDAPDLHVAGITEKNAGAEFASELGLDDFTESELQEVMTDDLDSDDVLSEDVLSDELADGDYRPQFSARLTQNFDQAFIPV
ncbi:hypothetical protein HDU96_003272 [Phlyctochytrium bullatum]|nr:hypothetical protein HDU96_003272 [Phlyctochytrium bullatum]